MPCRQHPDWLKGPGGGTRVLLGENAAGFPTVFRLSSLRPQSLLEAGGESSLHFKEGETEARGKGIACQHTLCFR